MMRWHCGRLVNNDYDNVQPSNDTDDVVNQKGTDDVIPTMILWCIITDNNKIDNVIT